MNMGRENSKTLANCDQTNMAATYVTSTAKTVTGKPVSIEFNWASQRADDEVSKVRKEKVSGYDPCIVDEYMGRFQDSAAAPSQHGVQNLFSELLVEFTKYGDQNAFIVLNLMTDMLNAQTTSKKKGGGAKIKPFGVVKFGKGKVYLLKIDHSTLRDSISEFQTIKLHGTHQDARTALALAARNTASLFEIEAAAESTSAPVLAAEETEATKHFLKEPTEAPPAEAPSSVPAPPAPPTDEAEAEAAVPEAAAEAKEPAPEEEPVIEEV